MQARALAARCGVPVLGGSPGAVTADEARAFLASLGDGGVVVIKAVAGGGGRGMRVVSKAEDVAEAWERCRSEARQAFGSGDLYVERLLPHARHLEVQVLGDGTGAVSHLWERECTLQRRHQKLVEMAPSPGLSAGLRARLLDAALRLAREVRFDNLGTFEFLLDASAGGDDAPFVFIEANPRLQVEHTVTEEVTGADLVKLQLRLASGCSLGDLGLDGPPAAPRGYAVQARVNTETIAADGGVRPAGGTLRDVRAAVRSGRPRRHRRPRRVPDEPALRLAAREGRRSHDGELGRGARAHGARPRRVPDRGRGDEPGVPAPPARASRRDREPHRHRLRDRARRRARRR